MKEAKEGEEAVCCVMGLATNSRSAGTQAHPHTLPLGFLFWDIIVQASIISISFVRVPRKSGVLVREDDSTRKSKMGRDDSQSGKWFCGRVRVDGLMGFGLRAMRFMLGPRIMIIGLDEVIFAV